MPAILQIPTQAVVECQLASDLPGVLRVHGPRPFPDLRIAGRLNRGGIRGAEQEAGVWESDRLTRHRGRTQIRLSCFRGVDIDPSGINQIGERPNILVPLASEFVRVVTLHPCEAAGGGGLVVPIVDAVGPSDAVAVGRIKASLRSAQTGYARKP